MRLTHFSPAEFVRRPNHGGALVDWFPLIEPRLLVALDTLRHRWGHPIMISPADGTIGRVGAANKNSDHYCDTTTEPPTLAHAIDIMPVIDVDGRRRGLNQAEAFNFALTAPLCGINALGIYPDWRPYPGFHVGLRSNPPARNKAGKLAEKARGRCASWGAIRTTTGKQNYTTAADAMSAWVYET